MENCVVAQRIAVLFFISSLFWDSAERKAGRPRKHKGLWLLLPR